KEEPSCFHPSSLNPHPSRSGQGGIRTPELRRGQIYSLVQLTALPPARESAPACDRDPTRSVVGRRGRRGKLAEGFEPTTGGLQTRCSTPELRERLRHPPHSSGQRPSPGSIYSRAAIFPVQAEFAARPSHPAALLPLPFTRPASGWEGSAWCVEF